MKTILSLTLLLSWGYLTPLAAQRLPKSEKAAQLEKEFQQTLALVESGCFKINIDRVYPQSGRDVSRFNPRGEIILSDSTAKGDLPFFGRAYSLPYGDSGSITFDGPAKERKLKTAKKKREKVIHYQFAVNSKNDRYTFHLVIGANGSCHISLISNNRASISYSGTLLPAKS